MLVQQVFREAVARMRAAEVPAPERDARLILAHVLGLSADRLTLHLNDALTDLQREAAEAAIARRVTRVPVSHIVGTRLFWGRSFAVSSAVLDPRPETECLIAAALENPAGRVLDLGVGSGCILLTLVSEWPSAEGIGTDVSPDALDVAARNAEALGLKARCRFQRADWYEGVEGAFDLIVSNPPYLAEAEMASLAPDLAYEPRGALTPGGDGLDAYRALAAGALAHLIPGGRLLVEIGPTQRAAVMELFAQAGLERVSCSPDLDGRDRIVAAYAPV